MSKYNIFTHKLDIYQKSKHYYKPMADKLTFFISAEIPWTKLTNQRGFCKASVIPKGKTFSAIGPLFGYFCSKLLISDINTKFQSIRSNAQ